MKIDPINGGAEIPGNTSTTSPINAITIPMICNRIQSFAFAKSPKNHRRLDRAEQKQRAGSR